MAIQAEKGGNDGVFRKARMACKPDSVPGCPGDDHSSDPSVAGGFKLPTRTPGLRCPCGDIDEVRKPGRSYPRGVPIRHCSRWGLPCRSGCPSRGGLLPHRFTLTRARRRGCLFSVALSLGLPPPGVTRHRCLMESGLSSNPQGPATVQPSAPPPLSRTPGARQSPAEKSARRQISPLSSLCAKYPGGAATGGGGSPRSAPPQGGAQRERRASGSFFQFRSGRTRASARHSGPGCRSPD